ncbi:MAG: hypothetical protein WBD28_08345 [Candidatus Zixiibacteriota bacterium]
MNSVLTDLIQHIEKFADKWNLPLDWFFSLNNYALERFGFFGQLALNLVIFAFAFLLLTKFVKASLEMVKFVVLPGLILSGITSYFLPYTFVNLLPFCIGVMVIINLLRPS